MFLRRRITSHGTCIIPAHKIKKGEYTLEFDLHKVPYTKKERLAHSLTGGKLRNGISYPDVLSTKLTHSVEEVAVLKVSKNGKAIHYEVWSPWYIRNISDTPHENRFPHFGEYNPSSDEYGTNYLVHHKLYDEEWKAEVLRRLQKQGKCIPQK